MQGKKTECPGSLEIGGALFSSTVLGLCSLNAGRCSLPASSFPRLDFALKTIATHASRLENIRGHTFGPRGGRASEATHQFVRIVAENDGTIGQTVLCHRETAQRVARMIEVPRSSKCRTEGGRAWRKWVQGGETRRKRLRYATLVRHVPLTFVTSSTFTSTLLARAEVHCTTGEFDREVCSRNVLGTISFKVQTRESTRERLDATNKPFEHQALGHNALPPCRTPQGFIAD